MTANASKGQPCARETGFSVWRPETVATNRTHAAIARLTEEARERIDRLCIHELRAEPDLFSGACNDEQLTCSASKSWFELPVICRARRDDVLKLCAGALGLRGVQSNLAAPAAIGPIGTYLSTKLVEMALDRFLDAARACLDRNPTASADATSSRQVGDRRPVKVVVVPIRVDSLAIEFEFDVAEVDIERIDATSIDEAARSWSDEESSLFEHEIRQSNVRLQAVLDDRRIAIGEARTWRAGSTLALKSTPRSTAYLLVGERRLFTCEIARTETFFALRILERCDATTGRPMSENGSIEDRGPRSSEAGQAGSLVDAIPLTLRVVLGSVSLPVREIASLGPGSLITLDRRLGHPVDLMINDRVICRGDIGVSDGETPHFVVRVIELSDSVRLSQPAR